MTVKTERKSSQKTPRQIKVLNDLIKTRFNKAAGYDIPDDVSDFKEMVRRGECPSIFGLVFSVNAMIYVDPRQPNAIHTAEHAITFGDYLVTVYKSKPRNFFVYSDQFGLIEHRPDTFVDAIKVAAQELHGQPAPRILPFDPPIVTSGFTPRTAPTIIEPAHFDEPPIEIYDNEDIGRYADVISAIDK